MSSFQETKADKLCTKSKAKQFLAYPLNHVVFLLQFNPGDKNSTHPLVIISEI